jgi:hypothetical protein
MPTTRNGRRRSFETHQKRATVGPGQVGVEALRVGAGPTFPF